MLFVAQEALIFVVINNLFIDPRLMEFTHDIKDADDVKLRRG